jgi:hypothetical protein
MHSHKREEKDTWNSIVHFVFLTCLFVILLQYDQKNWEASRISDRASAHFVRGRETRAQQHYTARRAVPRSTILDRSP